MRYCEHVTNDAPVRRFTSTIAPWPHYDDEQVEAAANVLRSGKVNYWTGQEGRQFEKEFAEWCGTRRAIVLANGSLALELAMIGLGLKPGDEIVTTPRTFLATSTSFAIYGIKPVFADVDLDSGNITAESVAAVLTPRTKAIVPVHIGGWPCDMPGLMALAEEKGLSVIEDCAQANGAEIDGKSVGSFGHINAWSFCQDKIMTTGGEGGMVTTDDEDAWSKMWSFKDHGKSWDAVYNRQHPIGFRWVHESMGTNWRLTEPQSAIGRVQLRRMDDWRAQRTANAQLITSRLSESPALRVPLPPANYTSAWYRAYAYVRPEALKDGWSRDRILAECADRGMNQQVGSCSEIYREKAFAGSGSVPSEPLPRARELGETSLVFLTHPGLSESSLHEWCDVLLDVVRQGTR